MACDAIKFIPTRTSRVMASQGGSRRKRAEGKEMPARSSGEQARGKRKGGCLEKHFQAAAASCKTWFEWKPSAKSEWQTGCACLAGWWFSLATDTDTDMRYAYKHTHTFAHTPIRTGTLATCSFGPTKVGRESCKMHLFEFVPEPPAEKWEMVWQLPKVGRQSTTTTATTQQHVSDTKNEEEEQLQRQLLVKCAVNARNMMINESKESERERERAHENAPKVRPVGEKNSRNIYGKVNCSQQGQLWSRTKPQQLP